LDLFVDFDKCDFINEKMFTILIDWLIEVHSKFEMCMETLFLTHQVITRYLTKVKTIRRSRLQLVGITALYMCAKYEEVDIPEIKDMVYICDKAYTKDEVMEMEWEIMREFNFNLLFVPTTFTFVSILTFFHTHVNDDTIKCICYLCELSLLKECFLKYKPSVIASSAIAIARDVQNAPLMWPKTLSFHTNYTILDLQNCINDFRVIFLDETLFGNAKENQNAIFRKYSKQSFKCVSQLFVKYDWKRVSINGMII
jgi:hypothetical protein